MTQVTGARPYAAAGALFQDDAGRVLLVIPTYKQQHDIPGGMVEPGETPRAACEREIREELSLHRTVGRLLVVDSQVYPTGDDILLFIFDGGELSPDERDSLAPDGVEISGFHFAAPETLDRFVPGDFASRLVNAVAARRSGDTFDLDKGRRTCA
ncbi:MULTISPECIES: NUDIX hydrolase [Catenuloplanes]|uniref:ADP-ribose pyrophosphatase YjhB (NUDIX family) n=1 Tax=Catenuloplanes niger TaxID=587534 RepID=A0AAE3ZZ96_9ACTN|nr:NUDIX hydrolase [Catenuloplanes niger]MDR7326753.1 ADP-ribose pyrophosphatase YjhB (NUDIX family) [Catenuloplanes niger]